MAKAKTYKVKALVNIKYDKTVIAVGKDFKIKKDDVKELIEKGYVELLEEVKEDNINQENDYESDNAGEEGAE